MVSYPLSNTFCISAVVIEIKCKFLHRTDYIDWIDGDWVLYAGMGTEGKNNRIFYLNIQFIDLYGKRDMLKQRGLTIILASLLMAGCEANPFLSATAKEQSSFGTLKSEYTFLPNGIRRYVSIQEINEVNYEPGIFGGRLYSIKLEPATYSVNVLCRYFRSYTHRKPRRHTHERPLTDFNKTFELTIHAGTVYKFYCDQDKSDTPIWVESD